MKWSIQINFAWFPVRVWECSKMFHTNDDNELIPCRRTVWFSYYYSVHHEYADETLSESNWLNYRQAVLFVCSLRCIDEVIEG